MLWQPLRPAAAAAAIEKATIKKLTKIFLYIAVPAAVAVFTAATQ